MNKEDKIIITDFSFVKKRACMCVKFKLYFLKIKCISLLTIIYDTIFSSEYDIIQCLNTFSSSNIIINILKNII